MKHLLAAIYEGVGAIAFVYVPADKFPMRYEIDYVRIYSP